LDVFEPGRLLAPATFPNLKIWTPAIFPNLKIWTPAIFPNLKIWTPATFPNLKIWTPADTLTILFREFASLIPETTTMVIPRKIKEKPRTNPYGHKN